MGRNPVATPTGVTVVSATSIEISFTYRGERCRERLKLEPTAANLKRAARHRAAIIDAIENGTFNYGFTFPDSPRAKRFARQPGQHMLLTDYLKGWLDRTQAHTASSTWKDWERIVCNQIIPALGNHELGQLRRAHVRDWAAGLTVSNKRIANILSPLRIALREAVDDELIEANPLSAWTYRRKEAPRRIDDVDPFTAEEQAAILGVLSGHGKNLLQFAFWTGLRTSELVALEWGDIDHLRKVARITRAKTQRSHAPEETKTRAGVRDIQLLPPAWDALHAQKALSFMHDSGRVFLNPRTLTPWEGDQAIRKTLWAHALKRAGVRYRRPYQTRHTYASMMLSAGEHPMWVAQQMGHADWTMIARVYGRWMPTANPSAGMKAVERFAEAQEGADKKAVKKLAN